MKFTTGDIVRFLNEKGGGEVISVLLGGKILVRTTDGFDIPYLATQLVLADPKAIEERNIEIPLGKKITNKKWLPQDRYNDFKNTWIELGVYFAIENTNTELFDEGNFNLYVFNNTEFDISFNINIRLSPNFFENIAHHVAPSNALTLVAKLKKNQLNNLPEYRLDILFSSTTPTNFPLPISILYKLKAVKILNSSLYKTITGYKEKFLFFKLYDPAKPNELPLVEDNSTILEARPSVEKKKSNNDVLEVDLHIEELTDKYTTMTPTEMLTLQQSICRQKIEFAIAKQYKKIVFIHGVGNGVLKQEVRKLLNNYIDLKYRDASPLKYGQGATEVLLDY